MLFNGCVVFSELVQESQFWVWRYFRDFSNAQCTANLNELILPMIKAGHLIAMVFLSALMPIMLAAQAPARLDRKVVEKVAPIYPELAKQMRIVGVVKVEVVVRSNGTVKSTKVVGGNPVLIQPAVDAVMKWKFEAASEESMGVVELIFDPGQ